jgi:glutamyl-Q tRNA(Asp) synthetase
MTAALARLTPLAFEDKGTSITANPQAWGDVILVRRDIGTSYHIAVVTDDSAQGITHVVRGRDLYLQTAIHRVLQDLLGLPAPRYHHHALIGDEAGRKLAKSAGDRSLRSLRASGVTPADIRRELGF